MKDESTKIERTRQGGGGGVKRPAKKYNATLRPPRREGVGVGARLPPLSLPACNNENNKNDGASNETLNVHKYRLRSGVAAPRSGGRGPVVRRVWRVRRLKGSLINQRSKCLVKPP